MPKRSLEEADLAELAEAITKRLASVTPGAQLSEIGHKLPLKKDADVETEINNLMGDSIDEGVIEHSVLEPDISTYSFDVGYPNFITEYQTTQLRKQIKNIVKVTVDENLEKKGRFKVVLTHTTNPRIRVGFSHIEPAVVSRPAPTPTVALDPVVANICSNMNSNIPFDPSDPGTLTIRRIQDGINVITISRTIIPPVRGEQLSIVCTHQNIKDLKLTPTKNSHRIKAVLEIFDEGPKAII